MPTSTFLGLVDGEEVRFDFSPPSSLAFQRLDAGGQPAGPEVPLFGPAQMMIDEAQQVDAFGAAALPGGGFAVAYEERSFIIGAGFFSENLKTVTFDAEGRLSASVDIPMGSFPAGTIITDPGVFGLSGDAVSVAYDRLDGGVPSHHLAVIEGGAPAADLVLASAPTSVADERGVLTLGFADGRHVTIGGAGADAIVAGPQGDVIRGGGGGDSIQGGAGSDSINGNAGDDAILGGAGDDIARGGQGNDVVQGGDGNDWLSGDRGDDTETGGAGGDTFHGSVDSGRDVITDFNAAAGDRVLLDPGTPFTVVQMGSDVIIEIGPNHDVFAAELVLKDVQLSSLPPGFVFLG
jgi:hypothetical protein